MILLLLAGAILAAPAPLPRHARTAGPSPLPRRCTMLWDGVAWRAEFCPGGGYVLGDGVRAHWVGTWRLEAFELIIRERYVGGSCPGDEATYRIRMSGCMRRGVFEDSRRTVVLIEP